ncbi:MAG TPA: helix-turn-helix domain-containing protein [Caldilineaceae bacterium]|nr:helix-turn-helix domain-containing protein [Caldilineaceae bacterium]
MQSLGAMLRERREAMGVTLAEVEVATRIRQKYLSALEAEEWHLLPGEVVGRGFLRNYADYLGLDPNEVMERRRAVVDANLTAALSATSAGAPLPPERAVDYRPKEVDLKDETEDIKRGEIRLAPLLGMLALAALVVLGWWGFTSLSDPIGDVLAGAQTRVAALFDRSEPEEPAAPAVTGVINEQNLPGAGGAVTDTVTGTITSTGPSPALTPSVVILGGDTQGAGEAPTPVAAAPSAGETGAQPPAGDQPAAQTEPPTGEQTVILVPTATPDTAAQTGQPPAVPPTPTPAPPTPTPEPPTPTPEPPTPTPEVPTPTPEPPTPEPPPPPVAAACADPRAVISGPGAGQVLSGIAGISGTAQHENFQYYKLEYAPGANAGGGYVYFDGSNSPVAGGLLGNLDTRVLANGEYTIRLTVVDQTGNFPPPCDVTVVVQN